MQYPCARGGEPVGLEYEHWARQLRIGRMLAHGSCLAHEYGLPATQLGNAVKLIRGGATITIDGQAGTITVDTEDPWRHRH